MREEEREQVNGVACHQELEHAKRSEIVKERKQKKGSRGHVRIGLATCLSLPLSLGPSVNAGSKG